MVGCSMEDSNPRKSLDAIAEQYSENVPSDLRQSYSFEWYLNELYENPSIARNAHQRLSDMFQHFGTEYDEDRGVVEYKFAS